MYKKKMQEIDEKKIKRISQVSVKNLFGMFNHTIPLNLDDRITIIHSPNGFGKTIILNLLDEMFSQQISALSATPFEEFRVDFDDGTSFWVTPTDQSSQESEEEGSSNFSPIDFHATNKPVFRMKYPSPFPSTQSRQPSLFDITAADYELYSKQMAEAQDELAQQEVMQRLKNHVSRIALERRGLSGWLRCDNQCLFILLQRRGY